MRSTAIDKVSVQVSNVKINIVAKLYIPINDQLAPSSRPKLLFIYDFIIIVSFFHFCFVSFRFVSLRYVAENKTRWRPW